MTGTRVHDETEHVETLRARLTEAEDMLRAIRNGEIDALVVEHAGGNQVYTLHSAEEPYRSLVEQMQEGAVVLNSGGDILYANARFAMLLGKPLESVVGGRIDPFVNPADRSDFEALLAAGHGRCRGRVISAHSGIVEVSLSLSTTVSARGNRLNLIVTDLSELLDANTHRALAERENRSKDKFLATMAHELRNPLGTIVQAVGVIEMTSGAGTTRANELIIRQVDHMARLIDDLLDIERIVSGNVRLNRRPLDMAGAIRTAVATFTDNGRLDRQIDVSTEPVWVDGDALRITQVLVNLVTNAAKYTPPGGRIRVDLRADGADAVLTVEDTGFGISPDLLPFIFDLYSQAERTIASARGGLGIGLTLVRRLVELHGGTIVASSAGDGQGSTFVVRLSRSAPERNAAVLSLRPDRRAAPRRVLVIEESGDAIKVLRAMLELAGHEVYDAADGVRGLELLDVARPDVGIIDINLPVMDGYKVARRIRQEPQGRDMLLLALSGGDPRGDAERTPEDPFDYHVAMPVDPEHLARLISAGREASPY